MSIKQTKNVHPIIKFLKNEKDLFLFDTETTGFGSKETPPGLLEFYGIKFKLKKDLNIELKETEKTFQINFNGYKYNGKYTSVERDSNGDISKIISNKENIVIKSNIPFIKDTYDEKSKEKLLFNTVGSLEEVGEIDELFKTDIPSAIDAIVVHKIIDKKSFNKKEQLDLMKRYLEKYKNKELPEKVEELEKKIKIMGVITTGEKTFEKKMKEKIEGTDKVAVATRYENQLKEGKEYYKAYKREKVFAEFLEEFGFRDNSTAPELNDEKREEITKALTENIYAGHNVFSFDMKQVIERNGIEKIDNPDIIDTMYLPIEYKDEDKFLSMDKYITKFLTKELSLIQQGFNNILKNIEKDLFPIVKDYEKKLLKNEDTISEKIKDFNKEISLLKTPAEKDEKKKEKYDYINTLLVKENQEFAKKYEKYLSFKDTFNEKWFSDLEGNNIQIDKMKVKDINEIEDIRNFDEIKILLKDLGYENEIANFEYLNSVLIKKRERKVIHTAKLDIELNSFVLERQLKNYVNKFGLEDVLTKSHEKEVINVIDSKEETKSDLIKNLKGMLGIKTSYSKNTLGSNDQIIERMDEIGIDQISLSNDNFGNAFNDYKEFKSEEKTNLASFEVKIEETGEVVSLVWTDKDSYVNAILLIKDYKIKRADLDILLEETNTKVMIPPHLDNEFENDNVFIKVEPYSKEDYTQDFKNKRILWINNKAVFNTENIKPLQFIWEGIKYNEKNTPMEDHKRINFSTNYQNIHIPSKSELEEIFPVEQYADIYENTNNIFEGAEMFRPYKDNVELLPDIDRLVEGLTDVPETPEEYKNVMLKELREAWDSHQMMDIVKKTAIELYVKKTKEYYQNLKSSDLKSLSSEDKEKANRFINEIDLGDLSRNKKEFFRFIDKEINENPEFKDFVKEIKTVYTDRILYEVESLTGFENYKTVFNYYFQMRKILNDLSEKGVGHGPGRGSAAGSIIAYMFKITDMDPVRYELLFERFMNPERVSMPDIDIDLPLDEFITKDHVIKILTDSFQLSENDLKSLLVMEYGYNEKIVDKMIERDYTKYVGKVATTIKSSEKTVLTNYARLRGVPLMALRNIQREYDTELSLEENIENINELGGLYYNIESLKDELHMLADLPTSTGAHAGAVMIPGLPENVTCPMLEGTSVFDKDIPEHESKWDLLGLKGMVLYFLLKAKKEVSQKTGKVEEIDFNFNVLEDTNVMKLIQDGFNANVFQIESDGMRKMLKSLSPLDFDTLITALALYRPGPMGAGAVDAFITNKYLDLQGKYMKYMTRPVKVGEITNVDSDKAYDRIKDPKFKKLVDKKLFNKIMNTTSYFDSDLFKENTKGFLTEIVQRVTDGEHIEPNEEGLTTLEKKFLLYYESTKSISKAVDKAVGKAIEYENRILDSESYKEITKETSGTIVYQEQIMQMATKIAGFTKGQSDVLRKAVAKQNFKLLNSLKEDLINGFYNKIDTIKSKDLTIKRNDEFELVLNTKKFDNVNLYNTKIIFSELDGIDFEVATSKDKQYKILKSMGGDVTKIEEIKTNLKNIREEMKVLKYKSKAGEEVDVERFNELKVLKQSTIKELNVEEDTLEDRVKKTLTSEIKDSYTIEEDNIERLKTFDKTTAEYLFDKIVKFGEYAFNKSHSARYALLTYSSAFYKYYYPEKFYALALKQSSLDSAQEIFKEINSTDINVELMKLNDMNKDFDYDLEKHSISFSPLKMKSVSKNGIIALYEGLKKDGKYTSLLDARTRIPKKLLNKRTVLQLGKSGFFNDQIAPLTEKLFEEKFEEINDVLEDVLKINQTNFVKEVSSNTDYSNRDVKSYISLRAKLDKNIVIDIQLEEYAQQMSNIKNMFIEGNISEEDHAKDLEELKKSISSLYEEKNKEKIEESDLEFIFDFEKENKTYINKHLKKEHSNEELYGLVLEKIESKLGKEEVENFKNRVENGENYTEEEQNKVYMSVFAEYNFRKTAINLNGKEIEKDKLEIWMNEYYDNIYHGVNSSKGLSTTFRDDGIEPIDNEEKPNIFIGKNPKVVFMVDFLQDSNIIKSLSIGDEELRGEEKSFENNQGKVIKYFRYYDKENNEYKLEGVKTNTGYKKVLKRKVNKEWVEVKAEHKISFITKPETYLKEKVLPYVSNDLTIDDFAVMAYYPFKNKKEIPQKVLKSTIYFDAIKKRFKEKDFEIPLMLIGGTEPIKKTKDLHNMKLKTQYYYPETFNFKNKEQSKGKTYKELQKHMMSVIYVENAWHGFAANKQMEENLQNIITKTIKGINYVENKSVQLGKTQRNSLEEDNTTKMS